MLKDRNILGDGSQQQLLHHSTLMIKTLEELKNKDCYWLIEHCIATIEVNLLIKIHGVAEKESDDQRNAFM